jgi:hypothetical protein
VDPEHHARGDEHPSARWNPDKAVWVCDVSGRGGGAVDLARRLAIDEQPKPIRKRKAKGGGGAYLATMIRTVEHVDLA